MPFGETFDAGLFWDPLVDIEGKTGDLLRDRPCALEGFGDAFGQVRTDDSLCQIAVDTDGEQPQHVKP